MHADFAEFPRPSQVDEVLEVLASSSGVRAITIGGSRTTGGADSESDWDLGVFYRGDFDWSHLAEFGEVHPPGSWGRFMNGGAWLRVGNVGVDVLFRDLDSVEHWTELAERGQYEVDMLLGYLAGFPSYTLVAEVASSKVLFGNLEIDPVYPEALAVNASERWTFQRDFSIDYALMHARRRNEVGALGNLARAAMEEGHRRMCAKREWVLNEKHLLGRAGLDDVFAVHLAKGDLVALIERFSASLRE